MEDEVVLDDELVEMVLDVELVVVEDNVVEDAVELSVDELLELVEEEVVETCEVEVVPVEVCEL